MSVAAHRKALRASLSGYLKNRIIGVTDATRTKKIVDEIKEAAESLLSEVVSEWQYTNSSVYSFPDEVLALCFTLMPFADRVSASHVSRRWRYVSLTYPAVWSCIELEDWLIHKPALFKMALDRTGSHPVDILGCPTFDDDGLVEDSLAAHIHHIRCIIYTAMPRPGFLLLHAPRLVLLRGGADAEDLHITPEFLGGQVGRLMSLQARVLVLPATCPALSTVVHLRMLAPSTTQDATHFGQLFDLFPVLESLVLMGMTSEIDPFLPTGPVPASLGHILLESNEEDYDLSVLCATWRLGGVRDIEVYQNATAGEHLPHFFTGAFSVTVRRKRESGTTGVISMGPGDPYSFPVVTSAPLFVVVYTRNQPKLLIRPSGGSMCTHRQTPEVSGLTNGKEYAGDRRREIEYWEDEDDLGVPAAMLLEFQSTLAGVNTMSMPATCLPDYFSVIEVLPALERLELKVHPIYGPPGEHIFLWDVLEHIPRLKELRPALQAVMLSVSCSLRCPPTRQDADGLITRLQGYADLLPVFVTGFSVDALQDFEVPDFEGFWVAFVPSK